MTSRKDKAPEQASSTLGPAAARVGDDHVCRHTRGGAPHRGGEILQPGAGTVLIGLSPAARAGDRCACEGGEYDLIVEGEPTVLIGGRQAVRRGDATGGGLVVEGEDTVRIGPARRPRSGADAVPRAKLGSRSLTASGARPLMRPRGDAK